MPLDVSVAEEQQNNNGNNHVGLIMNALGLHYVLLMFVLLVTVIQISCVYRGQIHILYSRNSQSLHTLRIYQLADSRVIASA